MVPTTEEDVKQLDSISEFYDALASEYDAMTSFERRFVHEKPFFRVLVEKYKIRTALDAGCGTGFHSLLLAQLGVKMTAVDISTEMLERVQRHAKEMELSISTLRSSFQTLRSNTIGSYDAVVSLGNSLPHLLSLDDLRSAIVNFAAILKPGGVLFLQNLNYERILSRQERVQSVKEAGDTTFVRFYDYERPFLSFNILTIRRHGGDSVEQLRTIRLRPIVSAELLPLLTESGFVDIKTYGGITMEEFRPLEAKDLVILARKPE
jgi:2-polyprenyl-3-methyl-5-hydroxy-6-metoxy-1,4-benzoquinol methylase